MVVSLKYLSFLIALFLLMAGCKKENKPDISKALPKVTTENPSDITVSSVSMGGNVTFDGSTEVTERGFCWNTSPNPTINDNKVKSGTGTGVYTYNITGLSSSTIFYVRAFATNLVGTTYGDMITFVTNAIDVDGNIYHTVTLGTQIWMVENLKTTRYRNGDAIPNITSNTTWENLTSGAYCNYNNDALNLATYGGLYNYEAIKDPRNVCPQGWKLPTNDDWQKLVVFLGGNNIAGGKMKEAGTLHWDAPNTGADNSSGFTGLPGGNRGYGGFHSLGNSCYFWSNPSSTFSRALLYNFADISGIGNSSDVLGLSIRCLKE